MTLLTLLKRLEEIEAAATKGPWKYDLGNWEVEGPRPERWPICSMTPIERYGFDDAVNPVSSLADGAFIAVSRLLLKPLLDVVRAASGLRNKREFDCQIVEANDWEKLRDALARLQESGKDL